MRTWMKLFRVGPKKPRRAQGALALFRRQDARSSSGPAAAAACPDRGRTHGADSSARLPGLYCSIQPDTWTEGLTGDRLGLGKPYGFPPFLPGLCCLCHDYHLTRRQNLREDTCLLSLNLPAIWIVDRLYDCSLIHG